MIHKKLYKAGTTVPESWYTLTFKEGYSLADYPNVKLQFIKDAYVLEINGKRYAQAAEPVKNQVKARDKFDVIGVAGVDNQLHAKLDFPCVMLTYEHDMMEIIGKELLDKPNKLLMAIKREVKRIGHTNAQ